MENHDDVISRRRARGRPRGWQDNTAQNTIKSLDRAMEVLEFVSLSEGQSLSSIADALGQSPATIYRVLVTLGGRGLVEFDSNQQHWHLGAQSFIIGARYLRKTSLVDCARPILRKLMETTGETANLGVEKEGSVLFLSQVETQANIRAFFPPGTLSQMHASGIGKVLLAYMERDRFDRLLSSSIFEGFTERSKTNAEDLKEDLKATRERGYAFDDEEKNIGMRCIAAPVFDMNQEVVAGISVSGPVSRISQNMLEELSQHVKSAAIDLSNAIGG
ncbi:MAG: IclR family transcriptional regulator, partial [Paracoccaceae bacterium]|nr:IclR family transcriptional regulator [Paracoccaceae bacterium]